MSRIIPALILAGLAALVAGCAQGGRIPQAEVPEIHDPGPSRTSRSPGMAPDPSAPGPQGTLPNPYVRPQ